MLDVATTFPKVVQALMPPASVLSAADVRTILEIAFLTVEADFDEEPEELATLEQLNNTLWRMADHEPEPMPIVSPLPLPEDDEARIASLRKRASSLTGAAARDLAYAVAYLFMVIDFAVDPTESTMLDELRRELGLDEREASNIAERTAVIITPDASAAQSA